MSTTRLAVLRAELDAVRTAHAHAVADVDALPRRSFAQDGVLQAATSRMGRLAALLTELEQECRREEARP